MNMFKDHQGNTSSMRIVWTFAVVLILITWSALSFKNGTMQSFSMGDAAWFAALFGGKVAQSFVERKSETSEENYNNNL